jgi:hypothetical protein
MAKDTPWDKNLSVTCGGTWPWKEAFTTCRQRLCALPAPAWPAQTIPATQEGGPPRRGSSRRYARAHRAGRYARPGS